MPLRQAPAYAGGLARAAALALVAALVAGILVVLLPASPDRASELLLKAVGAPPVRAASAHATHAAHAAHRSRAGPAAAIRSEAAKTAGSATPLFASAAVAAKAAREGATMPANPSTKFLRKEVRSAGKAAVKVAALAKSAQASATAAQQSKAELVRARVAKIPLHTAMKIVEKGAAHSLAQADANAVEAALLRATLSVPGQRKAEKAAAAAAARAAADKPSAAWLAGAKSLADRNPYAAMNIPTREPQLRQRGFTKNRSQALKRGKLAALSRAKRGVLASRGRTALTHSGYSEDEGAAYRKQAGRHPIDMGGNDKVISTIHPDESGEIERPNYNDPFVRGTHSMGTPVKPAQVERQWRNGHYHPYQIVHRDDRYVSVGRMLTHRGGITRRESKMPTVAEEEEGGVDTEEEQEPEEEEEEGAQQNCEWGKDVYGRCLKECTPSRDDYSKCHDGSPIWQDPVPLNVLCKGHENATWCQEPEGEEGGEGDEAADKARTVQLASISGGQGAMMGGNAPEQNAADAPTLAGGIPVAGGKVVWLPLKSLTHGARGSSDVPQSAQPAAEVAAPVAAEVPKWDPKKFSKEVVYGRNGKPLYAFYARDDAGNAAVAMRTEKANTGEQQLSDSRENAADLSETDKEIERKVLFKLLREEEEAASVQARAQQLEGKSVGARMASSWSVSLVVSLAALVAPLLLLR